ncbi:DUF5615 family PIN-like protein [Roseiflexus sp. RS-1]|jgi:hypothetical protein|uniref:DUF5615 family PIN-like protein n=1 Tax=Roseiflexus sp. (strain RS-1) TaxID=357808 RepID=UPI0000D7F3DA|nr:DUF5615 family PIN-like protein [Roseiflexus sp. RS-1]ABQ90329.1 hypothetical protein RoseRS_1941 [Roseiflexus sp. RS-1]
MARLYANEHFPLPAVEEVRRSGHDVLTSYESGRAGQAVSDEDVLAFAGAEECIVITLNRKHKAMGCQARESSAAVSTAAAAAPGT